MIISLAILSCTNNLIQQDIAVLVLGRKVETAYNAKKRGYDVPICYNYTNRYSLLSIARLDKL
jgi:hypothetical protein